MGCTPSVNLASNFGSHGSGGATSMTGSAEGGPGKSFPAVEIEREKVRNFSAISGSMASKAGPMSHIKFC